MEQAQRASQKVSVERVLTEEEARQRRDRSTNATTGASAASARALAARAVAFYFRAPVKAFFRTRVDYLAAARAINPSIQAQAAWSLNTSTPGLLVHAVRTQGWRFLPEQVLPPLAANVAIGAILYFSYLQALGLLHPGSGESRKRVFPPPTFQQASLAGLIAGTVSSLVAAPFDALQVRFDTSDMLVGKYKTMWQYGKLKLKEIGPRGVFAGWGLTLAKDGLGYGAFFGTFEYVKAQGFYNFITWRYGNIQLDNRLDKYRHGPKGTTGKPTIRPHWAVEPIFLLLAGMSATVAQQSIHYPLTVIQNIHYARLETIDHELKDQRGQSRRAAFSTYKRAYIQTMQHCKIEAKSAGGLSRWLYRGFILNTIRQVPSTSAGLIIFEMVRRRYAQSSDEIRISKDGFEILLN